MRLLLPNSLIIISQFLCLLCLGFWSSVTWPTVDTSQGGGMPRGGKQTRRNDPAHASVPDGACFGLPPLTPHRHSPVCAIPTDVGFAGSHLLTSARRPNEAEDQRSSGGRFRVETTACQRGLAGVHEENGQPLSSVHGPIATVTFDALHATCVPGRQRDIGSRARRRP
jgi:hypothetical protein